MRFKKWASVIFCALFILMLTLPLIFTNFKPGQVSELENRMLKTFPALYDADGMRNKNISAEFEEWFNDNVGFREELFAVNATMQYELFHSSASGRVVRGTDGWLFYADENNLAIAAEEYPNFDEDTLSEICQKLKFIQKTLSVQGIEFMILLPPSKVSIYPEYLPGNFEICRTPVDILADYLEQNSTIKVIRLKQALLDEKEAGNDLLYFKTDTHWNAYGSYIGYRETIHKMNEWGIVNSTPAEVHFIEKTALHDLIKMIVKNNAKYYETAISQFEICNPNAVLIKEGKKYESIINCTAKTYPVDSCYYINSNQSNPSFLVLCDSMFMDCGWPKLLAENSSELVGVRTYNLTQELLDIVQPEVVVLEVTERKLSEIKNIYQSYSQSLLEIQISDLDVDIFYSDFGCFSKVWFPIWSEEYEQADLNWYEAERSDENTWHVQINLEDHLSEGVYYVHVYQGAEEPEMLLTACTFAYS